MYLDVVIYYKLFVFQLDKIGLVDMVKFSTIFGCFRTMLLYSSKLIFPSLFTSTYTKLINSIIINCRDKTLLGEWNEWFKSQLNLISNYYHRLLAIRNFKRMEWMIEFTIEFIANLMCYLRKGVIHECFHLSIWKLNTSHSKYGCF